MDNGAPEAASATPPLCRLTPGRGLDLAGHAIVQRRGHLSESLAVLLGALAVQGQPVVLKHLPGLDRR